MGQTRIVQRFEDLIAWQKARELAKFVFQLTADLRESRHLRFSEQFESAALSVMNNIAEGYERNSRADFSRFLVIAKGSCGEVRSMAYVALDSGFIDQELHAALLDLTDQIARIIRGLRTTVDRQRENERPRASNRQQPRLSSKLEARSSELQSA